MSVSLFHFDVKDLGWVGYKASGINFNGVHCTVKWNLGKDCRIKIDSQQWPHDVNRDDHLYVFRFSEWSEKLLPGLWLAETLLARDLPQCQYCQCLAPHVTSLHCHMRKWIKYWYLTNVAQKNKECLMEMIWIKPHVWCRYKLIWIKMYELRDTEGSWY